MIKALIAVRSGSKRVLNKNIRKFADSNLLTLKIEQLKRIPGLDGIVVNSNDAHMLQIASKLGVDTVLRDEKYASDNVSMSEVYVDMAKNIDADIIIYANATNPLLLDTTVIECIETFKANNEAYDSLNTGHLIKEFMFEDGRPINYELTKQPRSQDLPNIFALNFAVSVIKKENMIKYKNVVGLTPYIFNIDLYEAVDIDNEIDFEIAEYLYLKKRFSH